MGYNSAFNLNSPCGLSLRPYTEEDAEDLLLPTDTPPLPTDTPTDTPPIVISNILDSNDMKYAGAAAGAGLILVDAADDTVNTLGRGGDDEWTSLRRELGEVWRVALPIAVIQVGLVLMGTVDTAMVGRVSPEALAGRDWRRITPF